MESKDKMIGTILIIVGLFFIGMGAYVMMNTKNAATPNAVYSEQQVENTVDNNTENELDNNEQTVINVYEETQTQNTNNEDQTKYIY